MNASSSRLDPAFIRRQHQRLMELRAQLRRATRAGEAEEGGLNAQSQNEAHEFEEDATYGLSDVSGRPIAKERLEAMPEAIDAVEDTGKK